MPIRVLIIDDHFAQRLGLRVAINKEKDMKVVGQGACVADAVRLYADMKPDVTLMDFTLPDGTGVEAVRRIHAADRLAKIIMLTILDGEEDIFRASEAGASGYLTKADDSKTLIKAIRTVADGQMFFPKAARAKVDARMQREPLTHREQEILQWIVKGLINKEIGATLGITEGTVKLHITKLLAKIGALDRKQAIVIAMERGLVRL